MKILTLALLALLASCGKDPSKNPSPNNPFQDPKEILYNDFETNDIFLNFRTYEFDQTYRDIAIWIKTENGDLGCNGQVMLIERAFSLANFDEPGCESLNGTYGYSITNVCQGYDQEYFKCGYNTKLDIILNKK